MLHFTFVANLPNTADVNGKQGGSNYLVALAGMKALESHVQDPSRGRKWKDRVASWEERAGLQNSSVKLALGFLDVLGVSLWLRIPQVGLHNDPGSLLVVTPRILNGCT